jgi:peptidoglycan/LPS O-acetylase OafA/YrhL
MQNNNFRHDINGLRAIAVIAVVLFHFNASWMPGGFAGVDVFFVISGFLMTGIVFRGIEQENFSILKFYVARANRIIPALAVLCLVLLIFGWFYLTPLDYKALGKHAASSVAFLSNIIYWRESGYFDAASHEKWLLHTWSLSVEWQFYIIYPLVLVAMRKFMSIKTMKVLLLVGTVLGFVFCVIATYKWPDASYYLLPTRAWEMMLGGIAYLYPLTLQENRKKLFEWTGLGLIIGSYFLISSENPWPGYLAIFPVLGSFLLIQANRNNSIITNNFIFQKLGTWSYSIYLWHWPIVVAIYMYSLDYKYSYLGVGLSILLGFISYKYVERFKFKNNFKSYIQYLSFKPLYMVIVISVIGASSFYSNGFDYRVSENVRIKNINAIKAINDWSYPEPNFTIGDSDVRLIKGSSDKNILFIGASHVEQTYPYVEYLNSEYNVYYLTKGGCFITPSYVHPKWSCENIQNYKPIISSVKFDKIVSSIYLLTSHLPLDEPTKSNELKNRVSEYKDFLEFAKANSNEVFIILGEPTGREFDPKLSVRHNLRNFITKKEAKDNYKDQYEVLNDITNIGGVEVIDPIEHLCDDICMTMDTDFQFYYKDSTHMRPWYARKSLGYLDVIFR